MSEMTFTDGEKIVFNLHCDCGLTGGCKKCIPKYFPSVQEIQWDIDLAEQGMDEYNNILLDDDDIND